MGLATRMLAAVEDQARAVGYVRLRLRTGKPQPEAVHVYEKAGYRRISAFGRWVNDPTAWCYEKEL